MSTLLLAVCLCLQDAEPREKAAIDAVAEEMLKLGRFCVGNKAYVDGYMELKRGLTATGSKKLEDEFKKVPSKGDAAKPDFAAKLDAERAKTNQKCADLLADAALALQKDGRTAAWERLLWRIQLHFPSDKIFEKLGVAWFEPYLAWIDRAAVKRHEAGDEHHDGEWLTAEQVRILNRAHKTWDDPWKVADGVHEVRTTADLRTAKTYLAQVGAFRALFLREFSGFWDLKAPDGLLPVYYTETYKEMVERTKEHGLDVEKEETRGCAWYLQGSGSCNPCFVTTEIRFTDGKMYKAPVTDTFFTLRHEISHQMAFEYSKHAALDDHVKHQVWSVEGFAQYMGSWTMERGRWRIASPKFVRLGSLMEEGPLAWAIVNRRQTVHVSKFVQWSRVDLQKVDTYNIGAGLAWFLMHGEGGRYKPAFCRLLERIHQVRDTDETWTECFPDVDMDKLHKEWMGFLEKQKVE